MLKRFLFIFFVIVSGIGIFGQKNSLSLTYTSTLSSKHVFLDSILITNLTQGGDTTLFGSDTILVLDYTTGFNESLSQYTSFLLLQNYPNPFFNNTFFEVVIPESGILNINVFNISGLNVLSMTGHYQTGVHKFSFTPAKKGFYLLNCTFLDKSYSIKVFRLGGKQEKVCEIDYLGMISRDGINSIKSTCFEFTYGDQLSSIGYYHFLTDSCVCIPTQDTIINFIFQDTNLCPPIFIDTRDSNSYSAVQIGSQCWMSENLAYLPSVSSPAYGSNTVPYYYVYNYVGTNVTEAKATSYYGIYGVLYNWPAVMQGEQSSNSVPSGVHGICPAGWHVPSDEEWKVLEGEIDSQYNYQDTVWDTIGWRGFDAGGNLKEAGIAHWLFPNTGASDTGGFTALPAGFRWSNGPSDYMEFRALFWTSREYAGLHAWRRTMQYDSDDIYRQYNFTKEFGLSVRCVQN